MTLKDLKLWLDSLPEQELEKKLVYNSMEYGISGDVNEISYTGDDLYYAGDQPVVLHTAKELKQLGYSKNEIAGLDVEIPKGHYYIELSNEYSILERFVS